MKLINIMWVFLIENGKAIVVVGGLITLFGTVLVNKKSGLETKKNNKKQDELNEKILEISNLMTGGDSYPMMILMPSNKDGSELIFSIGNSGDYDLVINNFSINAQDLFGPAVPIPNYRKPMGGVTITKGTAVGDLKFPFTISDKSRNFVVEYFAKNGRFVQYFNFINIDDRWIYATKVNKSGKSEDLTILIPKGFPEEIKW